MTDATDLRCSCGMGCSDPPIGEVSIGQGCIYVCWYHANAPRWAVSRNGEHIAWRAEKWEAESHAMECNLAYARFGVATVVELPSYVESGQFERWADR
jgi:hypothetical protein